MHASGSDRAHVLICDLDGTLIDSAPDLAAALNVLLAEHGRAALPLAAVKTMVGDGVPKLVERAFAAAGTLPKGAAFETAVVRYLEVYEGMMTERTRPYPDVVETLEALKRKGWRLAVCTNKPERASRAVISALGMGALFEAVAGGDSFPVRKPDPGHVLGLLDAMGAAPAAAVMLGDSRNDVAAARAAGLRAVVIASGYGPVPAAELDADVMIERFAELPGALATLMKS